MNKIRSSYWFKSILNNKEIRHCLSTLSHSLLCLLLGSFIFCNCATKNETRKANIPIVQPVNSLFISLYDSVVDFENKCELYTDCFTITNYDDGILFNAGEGVYYDNYKVVFLYKNFWFFIRDTNNLNYWFRKTNQVKSIEYNQIKHLLIDDRFTSSFFKKIGDTFILTERGGMCVIDTFKFEWEIE